MSVIDAIDEAVKQIRAHHNAEVKLLREALEPWRKIAARYTAPAYPDAYKLPVPMKLIRETAAALTKPKE